MNYAKTLEQVEIVNVIAPQVVRTCTRVNRSTVCSAEIDEKSVLWQKSGSVLRNTQKISSYFVLQGANLSKITRVLYRNKDLSFRIDPDGDVVVTLPEESSSGSMSLFFGNTKFNAPLVLTLGTK